MSNPFRAILLDVDGTLIRSNQIHAEAWAEAFNHFGIHATPHLLLPLIGMGGDQIIPLIANVSDKEGRGKEISDYRQRIFLDRYLDRIQPVPGAAQAVWQIMAQGIVVKIATSAATQELDSLLKIAGLQDLASDAVTAKGHTPSKPNPDLLLQALHILQYEPAEVVMLGDTEYDIEAARRAGIACIAVRTGGRSDATLAGALHIYDSVIEALAADLFARPVIAQPTPA